MNKTGSLPLLDDWQREGRISPLDAHFGRFVARGSGNEALGLLGAVVSRQRTLGHVCLDPCLPPDDLPGLDLAQTWQTIERLHTPWLSTGSRDIRPLVLDRQRLYLGRLYQAECAIAERVLRWSRAAPLEPPASEIVHRLFPDDGEATAVQRLAAVLAAVRPFTLITGGPGTGKTTTVLRVLALRLLQNPALSIQLLAPTGKAAARLTESLRINREQVQLPDFDPRHIPDRVSTVHRFLGLGRGRPRYDRHHPAPVDLVVLDEASMIDLPTMHRLLEALPETAHLILLGDPGQLASVEAGSVLADLVAPACSQRFTRETARALAAAGVALPDGADNGEPLDDCLVELTFSHRFSAERGIGLLASDVRSGNADWDKLLEIAATHPEVEVQPCPGERLPKNAFEPFLSDLNSRDHEEVELALHALGRARVLSPLRSGPAGVTELNRQIAEWLGQPGDRHEHGRPILVTRNAHALGVYNGDMGVLWKSGSEEGKRQRLRACFLTSQEHVHRLPLAELPEHETAYALTVHKSQGSEYDRILLVLPPEPHPIVTRELIYTALTRARDQVCILATPESWNAGIDSVTRRASGLTDRLLAGDGT